MTGVRVGLGFDVHPRDAGRPLLLGGVLWDGEAGLAGHSDGDVVCHGLADALLGAAGLGDVGDHFPDSDPRMAGISGLDLLGRTVAALTDAGLRATSVDLVVIAERPMVAPRRDDIRAALADRLGIPPETVSVKATRPEGLALAGDGVACLAVAVVTDRS